MNHLDAITVLDLSQVGPATRASGWLADYGATVVKVLPIPKGRPAVNPPAHAYSAGRGTERTAIDLKAPAGRELFLRLAARADVILESFRPGVVDRLGIGYRDVQPVNPRIVYCATTGFGQSGLRSQWAGHDLDYLAVGGYLANTERGRDGKPPVPGVTVADTAAGGMQAVMGILAALIGRAQTGQGSYLDVSVTDGVLALMSMQIDGILAQGGRPEPGSAPLDGRFACYDTYRTADDNWVAVAAIERVFWSNLCEALSLPEWIDKQWDPAAQPEIASRLAAAFLTRSRDDWVETLAGADTCVAPVLSLAEVAAEQRAGDGGTLAEARLPDGSRIEQLPPLLAGAQRRPSYDVLPPATASTDEVLTRFDLTAEEIAALRRDGVIA